MVWAELLLVAARVDFADGLDEDEIEQASEAIEHRLRPSRAGRYRGVSAR